MMEQEKVCVAMAAIHAALAQKYGETLTPEQQEEFSRDLDGHILEFADAVGRLLGASHNSPFNVLGRITAQMSHGLVCTLYQKEEAMAMAASKETLQ